MEKNNTFVMPGTLPELSDLSTRLWNKYHQCNDGLKIWYGMLYNQVAQEFNKIAGFSAVQILKNKGF